MSLLRKICSHLTGLNRKAYTLGIKKLKRAMPKEKVYLDYHPALKHGERGSIIKQKCLDYKNYFLALKYAKKGKNIANYLYNAYKKANLPVFEPSLSGRVKIRKPENMIMLAYRN